MKKIILKQFLVCKGLSGDDVGVARGTVFQKIRPGAGFKTGDFVEEKKLGAATVKRRLRGRSSAQSNQHLYAMVRSRNPINTSMR